jgi:hypothetical protein
VYSSTHPLPSHYIEVSHQLHAPIIGAKRRDIQEPIFGHPTRVSARNRTSRPLLSRHRVSVLNSPSGQVLRQAVHMCLHYLLHVFRFAHVYRQDLPQTRAHVPIRCYNGGSSLPVALKLYFPALLMIPLCLPKVDLGWKELSCSSR